MAYAQLSIEITGAGASRIPVTLVDFPGDPTASRVITTTVRADLERSGLFKLIDNGGQAFDENAPVNYADWKGKGADALAAGSIGRSADGRMEARFRLYDTQRRCRWAVLPM
jgi:TolB protein